MNLTYRIRISRMALGILNLRRGLLTLKIYALGKLVDLMVTLAQARNKRALETFKKACASYSERNKALLVEVSNLKRLPEDSRRQLLGTVSALQQEGKNLQMAASNWVYPRPMGAAVLDVILTHEHSKAINGKRRCESLSRIISRIKCDTFYWDLLIWFIVPGSRCEELLGDLNEEYLLRILSDGEASARAWYRYQGITTTAHLLWMKIECLAAVGTLIDLVGRWFKR
jgi:hypothetical protein